MGGSRWGARERGTGEGVRACRGGQGRLSQRGPEAQRPTCHSRGFSRDRVGQGLLQGQDLPHPSPASRVRRGRGLPWLPPPAPGNPVCAAMPYISSAHMPSPSLFSWLFSSSFPIIMRDVCLQTAPEISAPLPLLSPCRSCCRAPRLTVGRCDIGVSHLGLRTGSQAREEGGEVAWAGRSPRHGARG